MATRRSDPGLDPGERRPMKFDIDYQRICIDAIVIPDGSGYWIAVMSIDTWCVDYL